MRFFLLLLAITGLYPLKSFTQSTTATQAAAPQLKTRWTDAVTPASVHTAYPRPTMVRGQWQSLNGLWDYAILPKQAPAPSSFDGEILVPFPVESALSGVQQPLRPDQSLWYRRRFTYPAPERGKRVLLHFGAVDQQTVVFLNGKEVGAHSGGYDAFEFDITDILQAGNNELILQVWDPTNEGDGPHGKQVLNPHRIFYTAVSGIWQTVWLETVPEISIASLKLTPNVDSSFLAVHVDLSNVPGTPLTNYKIDAIASANGKVIGRATGSPGELLRLPVTPLHLWSAEDPFLYDLTIHLRDDGKLLDTVGSYFGMRKIEIKKDKNGIERIFLNNRYTYNLGVLDQGYWPDGLYTAPTDEALEYDIRSIKEMGFNTIRKHIKIEPARWYYHCDRLGMLVWQDMPSWFQKREMSAVAKKNFEAETARHLKNLYNNPSIVMWCLFNEDWGSFDQERLAPWVKDLDPTRILNANSGSFVGNWKGSELTDRHTYPDPTLPPYHGKAMVCGEFGGTFAPVAGHEWVAGKGFGHSSPPGFTLAERYRHMMEHLKILEKEGLSGSIFTEAFDVEREENGFITYDRAVFKIPKEVIREINQELLTVNQRPAQ